MLSKQDKTKKIADFKERLDAAEVLIIAENSGLSAKAMETLRLQLREAGGRAQVVKNTLARRALAGGRFEALTGQLNGALVYGTGKDPAQVAKIFSDLARDNPKFIVRGGAMAEQAAMDGAEVTALAKLPPRDQLIAQLMGTMQAPIGKFAATLQALPGGLARALAALKDKKAESDGG